MKKKVPKPPIHSMPDDIRKALATSPKAEATWKDITPLARNEWNCWVISVKKVETRLHHIKRMLGELAHGKRRPCCWSGCPHR